MLDQSIRDLRRLRHPARQLPLYSPEARIRSRRPSAPRRPQRFQLRRRSQRFQLRRRSQRFQLRRRRLHWQLQFCDLRRWSRLEPHEKQNRLTKYRGNQPNKDAGEPNAKELAWKLNIGITRSQKRSTKRANKNIKRKWGSIETS